MKRLFVLLLPWMVAAASAQVLRPAEITLTHNKAAAAWRDGDQCWVSPNSLINWGWAYTFVGNEATIQAEGRTVRVTGQTIEGKYLLPMREILSQLGSESNWLAGKDSMVVVGQCRSISVRNGKVLADFTLAAQPTVSFQENPNRIIIDFKGVAMGNWCRQDLDANARAGQFSSDTIRIILVTNERPILSGFKATRTFDLLYSLSQESGSTVTVPEIGTGTTPIIGTRINVGPVVLNLDTTNTTQFFVPFMKATGAVPRYRRIDPAAFELFFPRGVYVVPPQPIGSPSITAFETQESAEGLALSVRLARPMGIEITTTAGGVTISLVKPKVGDGKLAGKMIVVDAGHGGSDSGARSPDGKTLEKHLTLAVAKSLARQLLEQGASVIMTRKDDSFPALKERPEIANRNNADFFISIHINSNRTRTTSGSISFHHKGSTVGEVLALCIQDQLKHATGIPGIGVWSDGRIYDTGFAVLRLSKMPAVLLELGFINNSFDLPKMNAPGFSDAVGAAVVRGLKEYLGDGK